MTVSNEEQAEESGNLMIKEWIAGITNFNSVLRPISKFNHQSHHPSFAINRTLVTRTDINRSRFFDFVHNNTQLDKFKAFQPHGECYQHSRDFLFSYHNKHDLKGEASKENAICSVDVDPRALMKNVTPSHIQISLIRVDLCYCLLME